MTSTEHPSRVVADPGGTPTHFVRIVFGGLVLAGAVGLPSLSTASTLSGAQLGVWTLTKALFGALVGGGIAALIVRRLVRELWTGWVGVLGGVVPASLVASPSRQIAAAAAYGIGGAVLLALGWPLLKSGLDSGSVVFTFYGIVTMFVGVVIATTGAIARLVFARRRIVVEQPDDAVARHVGVFVMLALAALSLSSGLAETMPQSLHAAHGVPLRSGAWTRGCVSALVVEGVACPLELRYRIVADEHDRDVELEWEFTPARCEVVVDDGTRTREFDDDAGWLGVHVVAARDVVVTFVGQTTQTCWYRVRVRPPKASRR